MKNLYKHLKSGTDIRGTAVEGVENEHVELTDETVFNLTIGYCKWLVSKGIALGSKIAVGHDSRVSAQRIKSKVIEALTDFGFDVFDCSYASTPAMFMITVDLGASASIQITASHHPFNKNGLKFFTKDGGLDGSDITEITEFASETYINQNKAGSVQEVDYMKKYSQNLREMICREVNAENYEKPLLGKKIVVDAGNGVGGFYATDVLEPLGADITGSQFLDPDGMFPNHVPNPENKEAMKSVCDACIKHSADLGIIFDTDVDRGGCVDENGHEINRNRLVALAAIIALEGNEGGTIVTDSVTSTGLTDFINSDLGGVHYRFKRGYKNVINEQIKLQKEGVNCPLAIETSGHAAFRENYYLDDGAYLCTKIVIKSAQLSNQGKKLDALIENLKEPAVADEVRVKIECDDFKQYGMKILEDLEKYAQAKSDWKVANDNREGLRIFTLDGWFLLRLSVHDPIMPLNIESDTMGENTAIATQVLTFLSNYDKLNLSTLESFVK